jgi:hypothetical protein
MSGFLPPSARCELSRARRRYYVQRPEGGGHESVPSFDASAGTFAFASTSTNLVPTDTDGRADVYVAPF